MKTNISPTTQPKKASPSQMSRALITLGTFSLTAILSYGAAISGGNLKSIPYSSRDSAADAKLSQLTDGAGAGILDKLVIKLKIKAAEKAGSPPKASAFNAYLDTRLAQLDQMDDEVRAQYGTDYAFIFQYLYPRILESKLKENSAVSIFDQINTMFDTDPANTTAGTESLVTSLYRVVFWREGDSGGIAYWKGMVTGGQANGQTLPLLMACAAKADTGADGTNAKAWLVKNGKNCDGGGNAQTPATGMVATAPLNDTGIADCYNKTDIDSPSVSSDEWTYPRQDCRYGRDAATAAGKLTKKGGGKAGFDYTKVSNSGKDLPATATLGTGPNDWACTRDNVTGTLWEVKTTSGLRSQDHAYLWYKSDPKTNGGTVGYPDGYTEYQSTFRAGEQIAVTMNGKCSSPGNCDTEKFAAEVNRTGLCGKTNWRVPTRKELGSLVDYGQSSPSIEPEYFPNTLNTSYWTDTADQTSTPYAWCIEFNHGITQGWWKASGASVRLISNTNTIANTIDYLPNWGLGSAQLCSNYVEPSTGSISSGYFTDNGNGTVTDTRTWLTWKRCPEGATWKEGTCTGNQTRFSWSDALKEAQSSNFAGGGWRLPNIRELESIVEQKCSDASINLQAFPVTKTSTYWTSSTFSKPAVTDQAWGVSFDEGISSIMAKFNQFPIYLVRDSDKGSSVTNANTNTTPNVNVNTNTRTNVSGYFWRLDPKVGASGSCAVDPTKDTTCNSTTVDTRKELPCFDGSSIHGSWATCAFVNSTQ